MKKLITIALLCAMLLSCFAGCAMQKGEVDVDIVNVQNVGDETIQKAPTTVPTENVSKWEGGEIPNGSINSKTNEMSGIAVTIDADPSKNTVSLEKADLTWFDPKQTTHYLNDAADLAGFLVLRQFTSWSVFQDAYKEIAGTDLNYFDGHTFILKTNVDMNGVNIKNYNSAFMFGGTFDGGNHAIFNYKMTGVNSGGKGFFSKLTGSACVKNFSLLNGKCEVYSSAADKVTKQSDGKYKLESGQKNTFGVAVGFVETVSGKTITVSNIYTDCEVSSAKATDSTKNVFTTMGGVVGAVNGSGEAVIDNCASASSFDLDNKGFTNTTLSSNKKSYSQDKNYGYGLYTGGIVARVTGSAVVEITNCSFSGEISSANSYVAGILAQVASTGDVKVENCSVSGKIASTGSGTAGIAGQITKTSRFIMNNCHVLKGAEVKAGTISGGVVAYIVDIKTTEITNCSFAGTFTGDRSSGGVIGYCDNDYTVVKEDQSFLVENCDVTADAVVNLEIADKGNPSVGGVVGRVRAASMTMKDCDFAGKLNVTFTAAEKDVSQKMAAGGLIGILFDDNNAQSPEASATISNCTVTGTLRFLDNTDALCTGAIFVGGTANYTANTTNITYSGLTCAGVTIDTSDVKEGEKGTPMQALQNGNGPTVVGYQLSESYAPEGSEEGADKTLYDIRYVAVLNDVETAKAAGFKVTLVYKDADGNKVVKVQDKIVYAEKVFESVKGVDAAGKEVSYTAASFQGDYLVTLEINGVDVAYKTKEGTLEVLLTPFTATDAETINYGMTADHGKIVIEEPAA